MLDLIVHHPSLRLDNADRERFSMPLIDPIELLEGHLSWITERMVSDSGWK